MSSRYKVRGDRGRERDNKERERLIGRSDRDRDRERERERERDRDIDRERDKDRDRYRERDRGVSERERNDRDRDRDRLGERDRYDNKRERDRYDRIREKEREREREKLRERNREKVYISSNSRREGCRSDHCSSLPSAYSNDKVNHSGGSGGCPGKRSCERERSRSCTKRPISGDWAEYISSSGKKYYYNSITGVSQWEKPKDFIDPDDDDMLSKEENKYCSAPRRGDKTTTSSTPASLKTVASYDSGEDSKRRLHDAEDSTPDDASDISVDEEPYASNRYDNIPSNDRRDHKSSYHHRLSDERAPGDGIGGGNGSAGDIGSGGFDGDRGSDPRLDKRSEKMMMRMEQHRSSEKRSEPKADTRQDLLSIGKTEILQESSKDARLDPRDPRNHLRGHHQQSFNHGDQEERKMSDRNCINVQNQTSTTNASSSNNHNSNNNITSPGFVTDKKVATGNMYKDVTSSGDKVNSVNLASTNRNSTSTPASGQANCSGSMAPTDLLSPSQVNLTNLPKLISQLANTHGLPDLSGLSPQEALRTIQQALQLTKQVKQRSANQHIQNAQGAWLNYLSNINKLSTSNSPLNNTPLHNHGGVRESPSALLHSRQHASSSSNTPHSHSSHQKQYHQQQAHQNQSRHHHSQAHHHHSQQVQQQQHQSQTQQQTYSHHQSADGIRHELDLLTNRNWAHSPGSEVSVDSPTRGPSSVCSIPSGIGSTSLKPTVPSLTPSLVNYYNESLIEHVTGWPAELAEKQIKRYSEEAHEIGSLNSTRVSAELKMARSLVRFTEIQATLQEQRLLYLSRQISEVEEWKGQNLATHS